MSENGRVLFLAGRPPRTGGPPLGREAITVLQWGAGGNQRTGDPTRGSRNRSLTARASTHIIIHREVEMISQTGRYALSILGYLVRNQGTRTRSADIAAATGIPPNYLSKILNQLRKQRIVVAEKGWNGGFELRGDALKQPIRKVLEIFDGVDSTRRTDCLFGLPQCNADDPCPLHPYWERIRSIQNDMVTKVKVRDLDGGTA